MLINKIKIYTTATIPGAKILKAFGMVMGNAVRVRQYKYDLLAGKAGIAGADLLEVQKLLQESRTAAQTNMVQQLQKKYPDATAIVDVKFDAVHYDDKIVEMFVSGTGVKII